MRTFQSPTDNCGKLRSLRGSFFIGGGEFILFGEGCEKMAADFGREFLTVSPLSTAMSKDRSTFVEALDDVGLPGDNSSKIVNLPK